MARLYGINSKMRGKVGNFVYRQNMGNTVVSELPAPKDTPVRTEANMRRRMILANIVNFYKRCGKYLTPAFPNKAQNQSDYNAFLQANMQEGSAKIYLTKGMARTGACVAASYKLSEGDLESIGIEIGRDGLASSTIALGNDFEIDNTTTVQEFSQQVINNNRDFQNGDNIVAIYVQQRWDTVTNYPMITVNADRVKLDTLDASGTKLLQCVSSRAFTARDAHLSTATAPSGGVAWIHTREDANGKHVSTQYLMGDNVAVEDYDSGEAREEAIQSYGGLNEELYLLPVENEPLG